MSTNKTTNLNLHQWAQTDPIHRTEFNENFAHLDSAVSTLQTAIQTAGNCEMEVITYTGTGTYGDGKATKINFTQKPDVYFIAGDLAFIAGHSGTSSPTMIVKDATYSGSFVGTTTASWSGTQLSLSSGSEPRYQMNTKNKAYWVLGLRRKQ